MTAAALGALAIATLTLISALIADNGHTTRARFASSWSPADRTAAAQLDAQALAHPTGTRINHARMVYS